MILTGDVNLMNVADPTVPFARVREDFRAADIVFSNLECCLYDPPSGHAVETEGFFASPIIGGEALRNLHRQLLRYRPRWFNQQDRPAERV